MTATEQTLFDGFCTQLKRRLTLYKITPPPKADIVEITRAAYRLENIPPRDIQVTLGMLGARHVARICGAMCDFSTGKVKLFWTNEPPTGGDPPEALYVPSVKSEYGARA